jgi:AraC-like DNA-binding protein
MRGSDEAIGIILAPELVQQAAAQTAQTAPERVEIRNNFRTRDPLIEHIGLALFADLREDSVDGRLFAESAAHLLAVHLLRHYATHTYRVREYSGGLSRQKLQRGMELIHEHLEKDLKLGELAATVGVSPYHFARLFKQSTGQTPHQYVITCRIERAKHLLAHTDLSPRLQPRGEAASGYSRRRDRSPHRCCRTVHESFHLTRLLKRVVRVRHTVDARAPSSPRGNTDATVASSCTHLAHRLLVG